MDQLLNIYLEVRIMFRVNPNSRIANHKERFFHSCWLKTPPTQAPISLGSQTFRDKFRIVAAKEATIGYGISDLREKSFESKFF